MPELTQELVKSLFDYRDGELYWLDSGRFGGKDTTKPVGFISKGYKRVQITTKTFRKKFSLHRLIFLYHNGYLPKVIDHINGNKADNRIENLREITIADNTRNQSKNSNNMFKERNICKAGKSSYRIRFKFNGKSVHFGTFAKLEDAIARRNELFLEFGIHNEN